MTAPHITPEQWERLTTVFDAAIAVDTRERPSFIATACAGDDVVRLAVERLLLAHQRSGAFIEASPVADIVRELAADDDPLASRCIGEYRTVREIGRGGMGAVYLARRASSANSPLVALKLIRRGRDSEQVVARFHTERKILSLLDHPNIARLLDGGTTEDGRPYFVMDYIAGQAIDAFARTHELSLEDRLSLFGHVCSAVSYAHERRVIHRDIKPANILVTSDGVPKLLDFGIAKVLHAHGEQEAGLATHPDARPLTPEYASPEQVAALPLGPATDVYSLGVVLFELLTGRLPYAVRDRLPQHALQAIRATEPMRPSDAVIEDPARRDALRGELDDLVLTALRKEPECRQPSVSALADDIRRHLHARGHHAAQQLRGNGNDL
jgi:serine/threonine protein kinase